MALSLITVDEAKSWLGIVGTGEDTLLTTICNAVDTFVKKYCNREFESTTRTEKYHGTGSRELLLREYPVAEVSSIKINDVAESVSDYDLDNEAGVLYSKAGNIPRGVYNVQVTYTGGYTAQNLPADLKMGLYLAVESLYRRYKDRAVGLESQTISDWSRNYAGLPDGFPREALSFIDRYRTPNALAV